MRVVGTRNRFVKSSVPPGANDNCFTPTVSLSVCAVEGSVNKIPVKIIVDTGATLSVISDKFMLLIMSNRNDLGTFAQNERQVNIGVANSTVLRVDTCVVLSLKLGFLSWKWKFWVIKDLCFDVILGLDFLGATQGVVNFQLNSLSFGFNKEVSIPFISTPPVLVLNTLFDVNLSSSENLQLRDVVEEFGDVITRRIGKCDVSPYHFDVKDKSPIRSRPYSCAPPKMRIFRNIIDNLLNQGVISPSSSEYCCPGFLVKKKDGDFRLVVNHGPINDRISVDQFPLPTVESALQHLGGSQYFSVLDLNNSFHQCLLDPSCRKYTSFNTPWGQYEFNRIPMGANFGSQALSRVLDIILSDFKFNFVFHYVDDIIVYSSGFSEHIEHLRLVLNKLREVGLTVNPDKVSLCKQQVKFLGYLIGRDVLIMDPDKIAPVVNFPRPSSLKGVQKFLGLLGYYSRFIPNFADLAAPLNELRRQEVPFMWGLAQEKAFCMLKKKLSSPPVLHLPDFSKRFVVQADASSIAIGAVLSQRVDGLLAPVAFASRTFSLTERGLGVYEKETLAVLFALEKFSTYIEHEEFDLYTDNQALSWVLGHPHQLGKLGRWLLRLSRFRFKIYHIKGKENVVADVLSRMYDPSEFVVEQPNHLSLLQAYPDCFVNIKNEQARDDFCQQICRDIDNGVDVPYAIKDGYVCYTGKNKLGKKIVVPVKLRNLVIKYFHDSVFGGHLGVNKTFNKIAISFAWPSLKGDVSDYVRSCADCQLCKPAQMSRFGFSAAGVAPFPWHTVHVDIFGPLTRSKNGNICILILVDTFTKFVFLLPLKNMKAPTIVRALSERIWCFFGSPVQIVTDNARYFQSICFKNMCFRWAMKYFTSSPYFPKGNMVERFNRNLKACLTIFYNKDHALWDRDIDLINLGFNAAIHDTTGVPPYLPFLGRHPSHPLLNIWGLPGLLPPLSDADRDRLFGTMADRLEAAKQAVAARYDKNRISPPFSVGQLVLVRNFELPCLASGVSSKLIPKFGGPFIIKKWLGANTVMLVHPDNSRLFRKSHVEHLKAFVPRPPV